MVASFFALNQEELSRCHAEREQELRDDSLAFILFKDGVGEVTIGLGSLSGEIDEFVRIVTDESNSSIETDEDVVTKLWNADFDDITYRVVDDYLGSDLNAESSGEEPVAEIADQAELLPSLQDKGRVLVKQSDPLESIDAYLKRLIVTQSPSSEGETSNEMEREQYFQSMVASFFALNQEELSRCHAEREQELRDDGLSAFAETILVFTLLQDNPSAVRDVSGVLERIVDYAVGAREPVALSRLAALLRGFRRTHSLPDNVAALCDRLEAKITDPELVRSFESQLDRWTPETEAVLSYFEAIGRPVVDPLLKILHRVEGGRLHREICAVLINTAGDEIEQVLDRMDIDNAKVAHDAVYIAGRIGIKSLTPRIQELLYYPDRRVKEEMIELVANMTDPGVPDLLMSVAADADKGIRCKALQAAAAQGFPQAVRHVNLLAFAKDLPEKDPDEQEAIFKALGHVGDAVTVEHLCKFVDKRRLMDFSGKKEKKLLAIRALEHIKETSSIELLQKLARDSNETVRTRALRSLTALRHRMRNPAEDEEVSK
jgi:HEAT repeat protein